MEGAARWRDAGGWERGGGAVGREAAQEVGERWMRELGFGVDIFQYFSFHWPPEVSPSHVEPSDHDLMY